MRLTPHCRLLTFFLAWALAAFMLTGCSSEPEDRLGLIQERGSLVVVTRNTPTTYYQDRHGPTGLEFELARRFAEHIGVELDMRINSTLDQLYTSISAPDEQPDSADLAAAGLARNSARIDQVRYAQPYLHATPQVIYRRGNRQPRALEDLYDKRIMVLAGSSLVTLLRELQEEHPALVFEETEQVEVVDLLRLVNDNEIDHAVVYSNELVVNQAFYPAIHIGFDLAEARPIAWALPLGEENDSLAEAVDEFFSSIQADGTLDQLIERFYGHADVLDYVGARAFARHMQQRLPRFEALFREAGDQYGLDWRLLAAMGYQESLWDPDARSFTGVRGLMMLTLPTAQFVGVTNRIDPRQSIFGGARYLIWVRDQISADIPEPDRTWFAMAAYNVGLGHLNDARILTRNNGRDPDRWIDVKDHLPLLSKKQWYSQTRHGYARGSEPVHYVQNIRRYYDILQWVTQPPSESTQLPAGEYHSPGILEQLPQL